MVIGGEKVNNNESEGIITRYMKAKFKWKIMIGAGAAILIIFLIAILVLVVADPAFSLFGKDESIRTEDKKLTKAQKKFKERVNEVAEKYEKKNHVKVDKSLLVATLMYGGDYDYLYEDLSEEDLEWLEDVEDTDDIVKEFGLSVIKNGFKKAWEWYMENILHLPVTAEGIQRQAELRKYAASKSMMTRICDAMIKDNKVDLDYFEDNLTETIVPSLYAAHVDEENLEKTSRKIAQEIIYELAEVYRPWIEDDEENSSGKICKVGGNTKASIFANMSTDEFLQTMGPIAQADYSRTGVLASVTLAQAILESGWGKSGLTLQANNMFGIKCSTDWPPDKCGQWNTNEEYVPGNVTTITDGFKMYDSVEESVADHSELLTTSSRYNAILETDSYEEQITIIKNGGYATDSGYISKIIDLIETNHLDQWDVKTNTTSQNKVCTTDGLNGWSVRSIAPTRDDPAFTFYHWTNVGQCVWYAQSRAIEITMELEKNKKIDEATASELKRLNGLAYGNGGDIFDNAVTNGKYFKGSNNIREPKPGSYIVWKKVVPTYPNDPLYGHVAVVEEVDFVGGTITITEGWSTAGDSCPGTWDCIAFLKTTLALEDFYQGFGAQYTGNYAFSGYVYFLEPEG